MVPNGWEIHSISDIAEVKGGKRLPKGYTLQPEPNAHPYIRVTDMFDGGVSLDSIQYVPEEAVNAISRYKISTSDIFITVAGTLGIVGIIPEQLDGANLTENADKLTNLKIDQRFLLEMLRSPIVQSHIEAEKTTNAQPKLALTRIKGFKIPVPPLPEQRKIAKILSTWDKAISTTERLIDNSKQQKKALMQQLLTGKKRLLDDSGKPFEGEWEEASLDLLCRFTQGFQVGVEEQIPDAEIGSVRFIRIVDYTKDNEPPRYVKLKSNYYLVDESDVVMVRYGEAGLACRGLKGVIANNMFLIAPKTDSLSKLFLYEVLKFFYQKISSLAASSTMPALKFSDLKQFKIKLPNIIEQHKITSLLNNADKEIELLEQQLADLKQEKKALMQQLLTGKRRVTIDEAEVA